jgi:hypothetical protein
MNTIINGNAVKSQPMTVQIDRKTDPLIQKIRSIIYHRDDIDLFILELILLINIEQDRGADINDIMDYLVMSNAAISVRCRKLRDPEYGGIELPLLKTEKVGSAFIYYFTDQIDLNIGLALVQDIMHIKRISYQKYCDEKGIVVEQDNLNDVEDSSEYDEDDSECDEDDHDDEVYSEEDDEEYTEHQNNLLDEDLESKNEGNSSTKTESELDSDELSSIVTISEVLQIIDELSQSLSQKIIETVTESFVQVLDEKAEEINNRITELEKKFSQINIPKINKESREELMQRVRLLVKQKLSSKD